MPCGLSGSDCLDGMYKKTTERVNAARNRGRLGAALRRTDARQVEKLQRHEADQRLARGGRHHAGSGRRQRRERLHRHQETVRELHHRLGLEVDPRRQQRLALPRGGESLLPRALRHRSRVSAHRQRRLGGGQRPHEAGALAAPGRRLRHVPARREQDEGEAAGAVEQLAHRLRQRPCGTLAQRQEDSGI